MVSNSTWRMRPASVVEKERYREPDEPGAERGARRRRAIEDESFHREFGEDPEGMIMAEPNTRTCSYVGSKLLRSGLVLEIKNC